MSAGIRGGALMVCGTASDVGKSTVVAGLCRVLSRRGVKVAPFKAQNMALNSYVTRAGHEIGRAQAAQAFAAGVEPEVAMNPILLKPEGDQTSQVLVNGEAIGQLSAREYEGTKDGLLPVVLGALADLRSRFAVVILEGAGSPAEINLQAHDLVNLRIAEEAQVPAVIVGDIDRGGVFAALYGTLALLPRRQAALVRGFVINKFRGDPSLLRDGLVDLEGRCGVPTFGVLPYVEGVGLDGEDSLGLRALLATAAPVGEGDLLDVAVLAFPHLSNFTDLDALVLEPQVRVRFVEDVARFGTPDLVVLPGTKTTVADLAWLRGRGLEPALAAARAGGAMTIGLCGGYQMLGQRILDGVESATGEVAGLGYLPVETTFAERKLTRQRSGRALEEPVRGYEIHHGRVEQTGGEGGASTWLVLDDAYGETPDGTASPDGAVLGTSLHGLFDEDGFRHRFLAEVASRAGKQLSFTPVSFAAAREAQYDRFADLLEAHLDLDAVLALIGGVPPR